MNLKNMMIMIVTRQKPLIDIYHYLLGNYRYYLYYNTNKILIRTHIQEQIRFRIIFMEDECYNSGSCIKCGCMTTALQMSDKSCDNPCYPPMMNKKRWDNFMSDEVYLDYKTKNIWTYDSKRNKLILHKSKNKNNVCEINTRHGSLKG